MSNKIPSTLAWISGQDIKNDIALKGHARRVDLVGGLVMGDPYIEFIEIVICPRESFKDWLELYRHEISENKKELFVSVRGKKVVLHIASSEGYGATYVHLTSTPDFLLGLIGRASERGYRFTRDGITDKDGKVVPTPTEEDVFSLLQAEMVPAGKRNHVTQVVDDKSAPTQIDGDTYQVPSSSGDGHYNVTLGAEHATCDCPDYVHRGGEENPTHECKHIRRAKEQRSKS